MKGKRLTAWLCTAALLAQAVLVGFPGIALEVKAAETVTPKEGETYYYNLANGAYFLSGSSITVNGVATASGTELTVPGDYTIVKTYTDREDNEGTFTQFVSLYKQGDIHPDGVYDAKDLVAMKKYTQGIQISKAGQMAVESFTNNADAELMRDVLLGIKTPEEAFPKTGNAISYQSGSNSVMPIGGFLGPGYLNTSVVNLPSGAISDFRTDAIYALVADAGINLITATTNTMADGESVEAVQQKELALAEKYGISMYVQPSYAVQVGTNPEYFEQYLKELSNYDSFAGISLMDEPWTEYYLPENGTYTEDKSYNKMSALAQMTNQYTNLTGYTNLLPYWESMGTEAEYLQYLEAYFTSYGNPKQMSFDYYVFSDKETQRNAQEYFTGLKLIKQKAQEHNVPFWAVVQAGNYVSGNIIRDTKDTAYVTDGMTRWTVHTALAYGAQGITYYPLVQPYSYSQQKNWLGLTKSTYNYDRNGIIGADGTTTPYYEYIKNVNGQITAVDEVLMNAANCGVVVTEGSSAAAETGITDYGYGVLSHLISTGSAGAMAGCFDYYGQNAYYAVNYDYNNAQNITLYFNGDYSLSVTVNGATEIVNTTDGQYTISLRAGDGALVLVNGNVGEETGVQAFLAALANIPENAEMPKYYSAVAKAQTAYNSLDKIGKMNVSEELKNKLDSLVELASSYSPIYQLAGTQQEDAEYGRITVLDAPGSITDTLHKSNIPAQYGEVVFYVYNPTSNAVSASYNGVNVDLAGESWTMVTVPVSAYGTGDNALTFASEVSGQWKITCYYGKNDANLLARVEAVIDALPEAASIALYHEAQVKEARAMYEALSADLQSKVTNTAKLVACENKIAALKLELSGKLPLVIPNTAYGVAEGVAAEKNVYDEKYENVMSFADAEYFAIPASALTAEYQSSKSAILYVYNPTEENAYIGVQLGDNGWIHRDRLTLYPQTWTAVDLFDRGQTYTYESTSFVDNYLTAGETVYFYAIDGVGAASTFAGDGWLVSGVYGMNQYQAGDQVVFDVVAAEGLGGTKIGYEIVNTDQFGEVFAFESTEYFTLADTQKSAEFKSCHDVVFYIYNPTDTDVTGYATLTWEYNVYFMLKANSWNRIVLANYAAAENTKFVASDTTIAFSVNLPKSEKGKWMMTNFYGTPNLSDDGSAAVVEGLIDSLPNAEEITIKDFVAIDEAKNAYDALGIQQNYVSAEKKAKLDACIAAMDGYTVIYNSKTDTALMFAHTGDQPCTGTVTAADNETYGKVFRVEITEKAASGGYGAGFMIGENGSLTGVENLRFYMYNPMGQNINVEFYGDNWNKVFGTITLTPGWNEITLDCNSELSNSIAARIPISQNSVGVWQVSSFFSMTDTAINKETAKAVETKINALPDSQSLTLEHKAAVEEAQAAYDALSNEAKELVSADCKTKLTACLEKLATLDQPAAIERLNTQIANLPEATELTTADSAAVRAAGEAYNALSEENKAQVVGAEKLTACVEKVAFWDKLAEKTVVDAAYQVLGVDGTLTTGVDNNTFGKAMTVSGSTYLALTGNVKNENAAFRQSKNIGFYIYNPTDTDVDGYYTMDWVYNAHFLLKAKVWNYIEFADFGSAANKQFITSTDTVYFYANMTGEGWLVSSFYSESTDVEGLATVVDASYQVLGVDGTLTTGVDNNTFGKVMSVSSSTYLALTSGVKTENPVFKQSKDIVFYIYNPTDTNVDMNYTMDWGYYGYAQLKANSWNRIHLSDLGAATNKQFITSNNTVYFYAAFSGEGWLISSFYALPEIVTEQDPEAEAITAVNEQIAALPEATALTTAHSAAVRAASEAYNALSEEDKAQVVGAEKLTACVEKVAFWDKLAEKTVVDAAYQVLGVDGTLTTGVDNNTFGKVMTVSNSTYLALTNNVKSEKVAFRQSKNIGFYIYNPTNTDVDGYYTMDWVFNAHFLLKAQAWNYIEFADFGSAANKQFITSNDTVYFYANMTGEGWLVSSFYGEGTDVEGLAMVVDASYQVLGVDGTLTSNINDATFGKVMSVSGSTWMALTPNVKTENPAFKQSKDIVFYIYNPTDTNVELYYTMDWGYNAHVQLKANSWNRIHLSDLGAAANKQFITSNNTVYFYAAFSGEGWLISSFYALPDMG